MSTLSVADITANIIAKLKITAPGLSLEIGTPEAKIVSAVAEAIFENQVDSHLISTQLDIDTKSGSDLEDFVGVFAFGRLQGTGATGSITFTLLIPAVQRVFIPFGSQVFKPGDNTTPNTLYSTLSDATIAVGGQTVTIAAQAVVVGTSGNAPGGSVTGFSGGLGISTCTNVDPFTGGLDDESDDALRARFKKTFLRNIAGTVDFYNGLALQAKGVNRVKILGPVNKCEAQVQVGVAGTPVAIASRNCKFVWPDGYSVSEDKGQPDQAWFTDTVDYTFTSGTLSAPSITPATAIANKFLDISYEYCSTNSRNDPAKGITNKIDVYVDGSAPVQITEKISTKAITLSTDPTSKYYTGNFLPVPAAAGGLVGGTTKFQRLGSTPILVWPATIVIGVTTYTLGTNYRGVRDNTLNKGSEREMSGIVWLTTAPADNLTSLVTYTYNQIPAVLNGLVKKSKQIVSDPLIHAAQQKFLSMNFVVQYDQGVNPSEILPRVQSALTSYLGSLSFGAWIQFSDLITFLHNVPGIDNCRMATTGGDGVPFTVSVMEGGVSTGEVYTSDFQIDDSTLVAFDSCTLIRRSTNSF